MSATAGGGSGTTTNNYKLEVVGAASQTLTFDDNGNMTSDGTNTFAWDAEDVRHEVANMNGLRYPRDALLPVAA